jgi:hypothetical protein
MKGNSLFFKFRLQEQDILVEDFIEKTVLEARFLGPGKVQELSDNVIQPA